LLFLGRNFQTTNARKLTNGSKDADFRPVVFIWKKKQNIVLWGWGPGPDECESNKSLNLPLLWRYPQKNQVQNIPIYFLIETRILPASLEGLKSSLALSVTGKLRLDKVKAHLWLCGCKGLLGGCKETIHNYIQCESSRAALGASKRRWAPQTTRDAPKGIQKASINEVEVKLEARFSTLRTLAALRAVDQS